MISRKPPRSGGALVVHKKVLHRAAGYADDLRILPADVDHEKIVPPVQKARAARVAGDLRDALSGVRHGDAPVPCRNTGVRFRRKVRRFELGADALRRVHTAPARRPRREQGERPVGGEYRRLCAGGADIDADGVVHAVILPSFFSRLL